MQPSGNVEFDAGLAGKYARITTPILNPNTWNNIVATFDEQTQTAKIYLNGELVNVSNLEWDSGNIFPSTVHMQNNYTYDLVLGYGGYAPYFFGKIDEVKFFNEILSDNQVKYIHYGYFTPNVLVDILFVVLVSSIIIFDKITILKN